MRKTALGCTILEGHDIADLPLVSENSEILEAEINKKVDKVSGKGLSTNDYTTVEKNKLTGIEAGANKYVHPNTHPATMITTSDGKNVETKLNEIQGSKVELDEHKADYIHHTGYGVASGTNAKTITLDPIPSSYVEGMAISFKNTTQNTGEVTINVNGLGAKKILKSNGKELSSGSLQAGSIYTIRYNGSNFILQGEGGDSDEPILERTIKRTVIPTERFTTTSFFVSAISPRGTKLLLRGSGGGLAKLVKIFNVDDEGKVNLLYEDQADHYDGLRAMWVMDDGSFYAFSRYDNKLYAVQYTDGRILKWQIANVLAADVSQGIGSIDYHYIGVLSGTKNAQVWNRDGRVIWSTPIAQVAAGFTDITPYAIFTDSYDSSAYVIYYHNNNNFTYYLQWFDSTGTGVNSIVTFLDKQHDISYWGCVRGQLVLYSNGDETMRVFSKSQSRPITIVLNASVSSTRLNGLAMDWDQNIYTLSSTGVFSVRSFLNSPQSLKLATLSERLDNIHVANLYNVTNSLSGTPKRFLFNWSLVSPNESNFFYEIAYTKRG